MRRLKAPASKGFNRIAWDLRYPTVGPWTPPRPGRSGFGNRGGVLAPPGRYTVELAKRVDGKFVDLGQRQSFDVVPIHDGGTLPAPPMEQRVAFSKRAAKASATASTANQRIREQRQKVEAMQQVLMRSTLDKPELDDQTHDLMRRITVMQERLGGNARRDVMNDLGPVPIQSRIFVATLGSGPSYGPTPTHREQLEIAEKQLKQLENDLQAMIDEIAALEKQLDAAGVPWTPGR